MITRMDTIPYLYNPATRIGFSIEKTWGVGEKLVKHRDGERKVVCERADYDMSGCAYNCTPMPRGTPKCDTEVW